MVLLGLLVMILLLITTPLQFSGRQLSHRLPYRNALLGSKVSLNKSCCLLGDQERRVGLEYFENLAAKDESKAKQLLEAITIGRCQM